MTLEALFDRLWADYCAINPQAEAIAALLAERGETVRNDHIALRTFSDPRVDLDVVASGFTRLGYTAAGEYEFPVKKLFARHYEPPRAGLPKVFISQLLLEEFSAAFQDRIGGLLAQLPTNAPSRADFAAIGRPWTVSYAEYEALRAQSEYGAWMAAFGYRANHFTVDVGALKTFDTLGGLTSFLSDRGFAMNDAGGVIKGTPDQGLEQSSTLAAEVDVDFTDGTHAIGGCYYEFALRHHGFGAFIASSATRLFESTDRRTA